mmetsp:Transcript_30109/g.51253  ORF Transcript_30109/g.51253 Transcript_30109/m.51253 type:complete len:80 (-) Transcript_30109:918-1157(-)
MVHPNPKVKRVLGMGAKVMVIKLCWFCWKNPKGLERMDVCTTDEANLLFTKQSSPHFIHRTSSLFECAYLFSNNANPRS